MKVAIYARVSTEDQDANKQIINLREYCKNKKYEIYKEYVDVFSGAAISRPAFNDLMGDVRKYCFRGIVVTKLDRIGRSLSHIISIFDELRNKSVEFIATTQDINTTTAQGRFMWQILGAFAEFEREMIRERTREGLARSPNRHKVGKRGKDKKPRKKRGVLRNAISL